MALNQHTESIPSRRKNITLQRKKIIRRASLTEIKRQNLYEIRKSGASVEGEENKRILIINPKWDLEENQIKSYRRVWIEKRGELDYSMLWWDNTAEKKKSY